MTRAIHLNIVDEPQYEDSSPSPPKPPTPTTAPSASECCTTNSAEQPSQAPAETPQAAQQAPTPRQERALSWDITPSKDGSQRKNVTTLEPVTPPAGEPPPGSLKSADAWWGFPRPPGGGSGSRTRQQEHERDRWQKSDHGRVPRQAAGKEGG